MKFCPECGAKVLGSTARFCSECGSPFASFVADRVAEESGESSEPVGETDDAAGPDDAEGDEEPPDPYRWGALATALTRNAGASWFGQYPIRTASDVLDMFPYLAKLQEYYPFSRNFEVARPFGIPGPDIGSWDEPADVFARFEDHPLGPRLLGLLDKAGVIYEASPEEIVCIFETGLGPIVEHGNLCVRPDGTAVIQWSSELLLCWADRDHSKPIDLYMHSRLLHVPAVMQAAFFLAETPWPSTASMFAMPREVAFSESGIPEDLYPRPGILWTEDDLILIPELTDGQTSGYLAVEAPPWVVRGFYEISGDLTDEQLQRCLGLAMQAFPRIHKILTDGRREGEEQTAAPFAVVLGSSPDLGEAYADDVYYAPYLSLVNR